MGGGTPVGNRKLKDDTLFKGKTKNLILIEMNASQCKCAQVLAKRGRK